MSLPFPESHLQQAQPLTTAAYVAALQMYDLPELAEANDALWAAIGHRLRARGVAAPERLTRDRAVEAVWDDPALLLAQACGYPYMKGLRERVMLVATPRYRAHGCEGPFHCSVIVVRKTQPAKSLADLRGARAAVNSPTSGSGMNLFRAAVARHAERRPPFFAGVAFTGSHAASAEAVADGRADVAAIDAVTWAHLGTFRPALTRCLRALAWSARSPGLPLVTARANGSELRAVLRQVLDEVCADKTLLEARRTLRLEGFNALPDAHYWTVLAHERMAEDLGYPVLA